MSVVAVIAAAGLGTRLGSRDPKALVTLAGQPLVVHAVRSMYASAVVDRVVVIAPEDACSQFARIISEAGFEARVVPGGITRQASVASGLAAVGQADFVLIHDAARALTPPSQIRRVVAALKAGHVAVVPALRVVDTVKEVGSALPDGTEPVCATLNRGRLRAMQTPQGFTLDVIRAAHKADAALATSETTAAPDDAFLAERAGYEVVLVEGSERALKITRPLDLRIAELFAAMPADEAHDICEPRENVCEPRENVCEPREEYEAYKGGG